MSITVKSQAISIHTLRVEGDDDLVFDGDESFNFNPHPPSGG